VALVFGQLAHEVAVKERVDVVALDAGVVEGSQPRLGEQVPTRPFGMLAEVSQTDAAHARIRHTSR